ncbi:9586_t:CDS:2 [Funneliformis mosseae]|uniref:9586_t:CDS:1 n=1 Tax=Funneliformis mosseae TaxID=27381 RepID=A0A9N8V4S6_FUNMO|nr:9586_t:CDS:2 [Funneliformis mosseae]
MEGMTSKGTFLKSGPCPMILINTSWDDSLRESDTQEAQAVTYKEAESFEQTVH